jgi:hypothetical protein
MIVLKLELHSALDGSIEELGRMYIYNDGTGTQEIGNYNAKIMRKGIKDQFGPVYKTGYVFNHARKRDVIWKLILKAIQSCLT